MSSFDARIVLRPRTMDETFDLAVSYARASARDLRRPALILTFVPLAIAFGLGQGLSLDDGPTQIILLALVLIAERVMTVFAGAHLFHNPTSLRAATVAVLRRFDHLLVVGVILPLPLTLLLLGDEEFSSPLIWFGMLLGLGWPLLAAHWRYQSEVVLLERVPIRAALQRTRGLVTYRFGHALGMLVFSIIVRGLFAFGTMWTVSFALGFLLQFELGDQVGTWAALLGFAAAGPFVALVRLFDYVDARTRREGWDIQVRFNAVAQRARDAREKSAA